MIKRNHQWVVMKLKLYSSIVTVFLLTGCAGTIPVTYSAQNFVRYVGKADIGNFTYIPADVDIVGGANAISDVKRYRNLKRGETPPPRGLAKVAPNQLQNTAVGSIYVGVNIADLVKRATALELEKTGFLIGDNNSIQVSGDVLEFKLNDLGYSVDWTYSIRYKLVQKSDGLELLNKVYEADPKKTGKFGMPADYAPSINEMILSAYNKFITDEKVRKIFAQANQ